MVHCISEHRLIIMNVAWIGTHISRLVPTQVNFFFFKVKRARPLGAARHCSASSPGELAENTPL